MVFPCINKLVVNIVNCQETNKILIEKENGLQTITEMKLVFSSVTWEGKRIPFLCLRKWNSDLAWIVLWWHGESCHIPVGCGDSDKITANLQLCLRKGTKEAHTEVPLWFFA